jgi:hypothetical protein
MDELTTPVPIAGYQVRSFSIGRQEWGPYREASAAEYQALKNNPGWEVRAVYSLEDLHASGELVRLIEATSWLDPKDAPEDERLLVRLSNTDIFSVAVRKRSGAWITTGGSELPGYVVTAWKRVTLPGAHLERGSHGQG